MARMILMDWIIETEFSLNTQITGTLFAKFWLIAQVKIREIRFHSRN
jgi:hypothetical protein